MIELITSIFLFFNTSIVLFILQKTFSIHNKINELNIKYDFLDCIKNKCEVKK